MPAVVNINGAIFPPAEAKVSVFDRGFLYGDSVYEVIRTYAYAPFELDAHLKRLEHSAERIGVELPWNRTRTEAELERTLTAARGEDAPGADVAPWNRGERYVRIVVSRGAGEIGLDPGLAQDPLSIIIARPIQGPPMAVYQQGVQASVVAVQRNSPQAVDPSAKTGNYLNNVMAMREARAAGSFEAFMLDRDGFVTEGSSSNIFAVIDGVLVTPPIAAGILQGVTRGVVLELARKAKLQVEERPLRPADLSRATELFITSTIREIVPVTRLGHAPVGDGQLGPVTRQLHAEFRKRTS